MLKMDQTLADERFAFGNPEVFVQHLPTVEEISVHTAGFKEQIQHI